jgi:hypothetical protein
MAKLTDTQCKWVVASADFEFPEHYEHDPGRCHFAISGSKSAAIRESLDSRLDRLPHSPDHLAAEIRVGCS